MRKTGKGMAWVTAAGMLTAALAPQAAFGASQETTEDAVNIVWYRMAYDDESLAQDVEDAINEYIAPKIGVTVTMNCISSADYKTKLNMDLASGEEVDIFWTAGWFGASDLVNANAVYDISDLLQDYPGLYEVMPEKIWNSTKFGGKNYFIPNYKESAVGYSMETSQAFVDQYGWDMSSIKTFADIEPMLADLKADGVTYPLALQTGELFECVYLDQIGFVDGYGFAGVELDGDTTKIINVYQSELFQDFVEMMYRWNQEGYIDEQLASGISESDIQAGVRDQTVGFAQWTNIPNSDAEAGRRAGTDVVTVPITKLWITGNSGIGSAYGLSSKTEKADACMKFLELLNTDQTLADLCTYGLEGVNYEKDENGKVELIANSGFSFGLWMSTSYSAASLLTSDPDNKIELYSEFNDSSVASPITGFRFDPAGVEAEISAVNNAKAEYYLLLTRGFIEPEEGLADFNEALENAGIEKILEEMQKQLDTFYAEQQ